MEYTLSQVFTRKLIFPTLRHHFVFYLCRKKIKKKSQDHFSSSNEAPVKKAPRSTLHPTDTFSTRPHRSARTQPLGVRRTRRTLHSVPS